MQLPTRKAGNYDTETSAERGMAGRTKKKNVKKKVRERKRKLRIAKGTNWKSTRIKND
jgi:hypothetical protein